MTYFVKPVVCDYGIFRLENDGTHTLIDICNVRDNAEIVAEILEADVHHIVWGGKEE